MAGSSILVVENDAVLGRVLSRLLERWAYEVQLAGDAGEALSAVSRSMPTAMIIDVALPGLDGLQLTRALKMDPASRAIPIIALHDGGEDAEHEALAAGCAGGVGKPLDTNRVLALLRIFAPQGP